jgi:hypothetical protein
VLDSPPSNIDGFLSRDKWVSSIHPSTNISNKCCFSSPGKPYCVAVFLSKLTQLSQGNKVLGVPSSNMMVYFWEKHGFLKISWIVLFGTNVCFSPLKTLTGRQYSFQ